MDNRIIIPLPTAQKRLLNRDYIGSIKVVLRTPAKMGETVEDITHLLRERHNLQAGVADDFSFITPKQVTEVATQVSTALSLFLVVISGISLIVGGIVVGNIMLISVGERKREIGLRRALGARKKYSVSVSVRVYRCNGLRWIGGSDPGSRGRQDFELVHETGDGCFVEPFVLAFLFSGLVGVLAGISPAKRLPPRSSRGIKVLERKVKDELFKGFRIALHALVGHPVRTALSLVALLSAWLPSF